MSAKKTYFAILLFQSSSAGTSRAPLYSEDVVLLRAGSDDEARQKADAYARTLETTYDNADGESVTVSFIETVEVHNALYDDLSGDAVDLYSRHFRDIDAYRKFLAADED